ncbi:hypothetical protein PZ897_19025 [Hoeflea sp. YIM 152468]|uniref:hypothetical protein n=1 Tax=Hoeflea sp. YIM 152468 TaxID=3031759 RepID=UPI0023DC8ED2|nr:hypothetical protein [Hoeflea sp. YIM 152468]MDF1610281.1 hypothetical protein [Hoeflea sp. YIM 152468]
MYTMRALALYDPYAVFTNAVLEHLNSFRMIPGVRVAFMPFMKQTVPNVEFDFFDIVMIHYSVRVAFENYPPDFVEMLSRYAGLKVLFVQDEYDFTETTRSFIERAGIDLVFTCVPAAEIEKIYPASRFPDTRFINVLTGYVPASAPADLSGTRPLADRQVAIAYRGRELPYCYGDLGREKFSIAQLVKSHCDLKGVPCDIETTEGKRLYGSAWSEFVESSRATLITESGATCFDWDGSLRRSVDAFLARNPGADYDTVRAAIPELGRVDALMNQISPRVFEAISSGTVLIGFDGNYAGVLKPGRHFIPLSKDGGNLDEVLHQLNDQDLVERLRRQAFEEIVTTGRFGYPAFARTIAEALAQTPKLSKLFADPLPPQAVLTPAQALSSLPFRTLTPFPGLVSSVPLGRPEPILEGMLSPKVAKHLKAVISGTVRRMPPSLLEVVLRLMPRGLKNILRHLSS